MFNKANQKLLTDLRPRLMLAESAEEVKEIIRKAGGEISADDAEHLYDEVRLHNESNGKEIDDDEMDAVAGGADMDWINDGCAATCEPGSWCGSNDMCICFSVTYDRFFGFCPDGTKHIPERKPDGEYCTKCGARLVSYDNG